MATIVTRAGKGSPLTHTEVDANFTNLNDEAATKAPLASPALTGTPTAPTASVGTNTTQLATTAFVNAEIANDAPTKTGGGASGTWGININGTFDSSARSYSREWIEMPNYTGLYSPLNNAHFYPNNGSYGSWRIDGSRNGWGGIEFGYSGTSLMQASDGNNSGFHRNGYGWQFYWSGGSLVCFKNNYGGGTGATVLDSVNFGGIIGGMGAGSVGSYAFLFEVTQQITPVGTLRAGSDLRYANAVSDVNATTWAGYFTDAASGTWRLMGYTGRANASATNYAYIAGSRTSVWLRVS